jgi:pilus assembly protein TadC
MKLSPSPIKFSEIKERIGSESPPFFKKLRVYAIILGLIVPAITTSVASAGIVLPAWALIIAGVVTSVCGGIVGTSFLPTTDKNIQEKSIEINTKK